MNILKTIIIFIATFILPTMGIVLIFDGGIRLLLLGALFLTALLAYWYADKLILLSLGAREIIDADNQTLFQSIKGQTYRYHEKMPRVYLYSGHRVKCFLVEKLGSWSIVLDRSLIKKMNKEEIEALVSYIIKYKKVGHGKIQTIGMGMLSLILRSVYWVWGQFYLDKKSKLSKVGIFVTLIFIKPLMELILKLSKVNKEITGSFPLKSIYLQVDKEIISRSFTEFMVYHLDEETTLSDLIVEFLEEFPMLENCAFKESL